jgi:hypothetical protein
MLAPTSTRKAAMQATYEKALQRAHDENLEVTLLESWGAHVANPAHDGYYTVRFQKYTTSCNCPAGQRGIYCKHRSIVHELRVKLIRQREQAANYAKQNASVPARLLK